MDVHAYCRERVARSGSSFHYSFRLLDPARRRAIHALYALCRELDDTVDEARDPGIARLKLDWWREEIERLRAGRPRHPSTRALADSRPARPLPLELLNTLIDGLDADLRGQRLHSRADLDHYCYQVAGTVGLLSAAVFGYRDPATRDYACRLGQALQLTNIIRDLGEDARRGRIYLPEEDLARHHIGRQSLLALETPPGLTALLAEQAARAHQGYDQALDALPAIDRHSQRPGLAMASIYRCLLREIAADGYQVMRQRISLPPLRKLWLAWRSGHSRRAGR